MHLGRLLVDILCFCMRVDAASSTSFNKRAPEWKALLGGNNFHQYPTILEQKPHRFKPQLSKNLTDEKISRNEIPDKP